MKKRKQARGNRNAIVPKYGYICTSVKTCASPRAAHHVSAYMARTMVAEGKAHKVKAGLYRLASTDAGTWGSFIDACTAIPSAVICLASALSYYELTTFNPTVVSIALPRNVSPARVTFPPIKAYRFSERFYTPGIRVIRTERGKFRIYSQEKTICDCFRLRRSIGEDLAIEALRTYVRATDFDSKALSEMAIACRVTSVIRPYLKAWVE